jgi:transcriptional regulator with XRE-family HTH domain
MTKAVDPELEAFLGLNVRRRRQAKGLTQLELAAALGTTQPMVSDIEAGRRWVSFRMLRQLAGVLGVEPIELFLPPRQRRKAA